jgi:hypothetical protein
MKKITFMLLLGLLTYPPPVFGQRKAAQTLLTGHWEGVVTQDFKDAATGLTTRIEYKTYLDLTQKGETVTGVATFVYQDAAKNKSYRATMEIKGTFKKNVLLEYEETQIMRADSVPQSEWCQKKAELVFKKTPNAITLEGLWEGSTRSFGKCAPGRILLRKPPPRV